MRVVGAKASRPGRLRLGPPATEPPFASVAEHASSAETTNGRELEGKDVRGDRTVATRVGCAAIVVQGTLAAKGGCAAIHHAHEKKNFVSVVSAEPSW